METTEGLTATQVAVRRDPPPIDRGRSRVDRFLTFLLVLVAAVYLATAAVPRLFDQIDGQYAGAAREMIVRGVDSRDVFRDVRFYAFSNAGTVLGAAFRLYVLRIGLCLAKCIRFSPRPVVVMRLDFDCSGDAYQRAPRFTHSNGDRLRELRF